MQAVIIEDEKLSAEHLEYLLTSLSDDIEVIQILSSVQQANSWFEKNALPDVLFVDIKLTDGTGFDILDNIKNLPPTVFTTAYDNYAIKAFKYNGIDYLLKPINKKDLKKTLDKWEAQKSQMVNSLQASQQLLKSLIKKDYKKRFLIKIGEQYQVVETGQIAYVFSEDGLTFLMTNNAQKYPVDFSLDQLEDMIDPLQFFRINRKMLVTLEAVEQIHAYFNSRLLLKLFPPMEAEVIVSRDRVGAFKKWMDL